MHACARGTVLSLLEKPADDRDLGLSAIAREAVIAAITTETAIIENSGLPAVANALRAALPDAATVLTAGERHLLDEWLARIAGSFD